VFQTRRGLFNFKYRGIINGPSKHTDYIHHVGMIFVNQYRCCCYIKYFL